MAPLTASNTDNTAAAHSGEVPSVRVQQVQQAVVTPETVEEGGSVLWLSLKESEVESSVPIEDV